MYLIIHLFFRLDYVKELIMSDKDPNDGKGEDDFGPEDELDAFNDETFGGGGLGDEWKEDAHEELAMLTEQERTALKQSQDFFNFGSDGEELGGELEDGLEAAPTQNGGGGGAQLSHSSMVERMDQLSLQGGGLPPPPLTVQTQHQQPQHFPGPPQQQQQQQVIYHHQLPPQHQQPLPPQQLMQQPQQPQQQQFPLLPPSQRSSGDWATLDTCDALPHLSPTYTGYRDRTFCQGYCICMGHPARDIVWDILPRILNGIV